MSATLGSRFAEVVAAHPGRPAVVTPSDRWTYAELDRRSALVAGLLEAAGLRPGDRVGLVFGHDARMVSGLIGAVKAGLAYVPLDAAYPEPRLRYMLDDSAAPAVLTDHRNADLARRIAGNRPVLLVGSAPPQLSTVDARVHPDSAAYVLYTSGSTGLPKPVAQTHRNVLHHVRAWVEGLGIDREDRVSLQSAYSWDSAVQDTFAALLTGAALYPVDVKELGIAGLLDWLAAERVSVYHSTLPLFRALVRAMDARDARLPSMRMLALGGDHILLDDLEAVRRRFDAGCRLAGAYGSTECSCALLRVVDRGYRPPTGILPLGEPVVETSVELVDESGAVFEGAGEGEIVVRSDHLAPGYGRAEPPGTREGYRTGDLARRLPDGTLVLLGRSDLQVKISGMRVDVGEVESALNSLPDLREAVIAPFTDNRGERQLAAYVVAAEGAAPTLTSLRARLRETLPDHAVPTALVPLTALPLTANHKIDRMALPEPRAVSRPPGGARPILGRLEQRIHAAWSAVLEMGDAGEIGVEDNFFDLGGTSLRLAAVHDLLVQDPLVTALAPSLRMVDLYRLPTVRALAAALDTGEPGNGTKTADLITAADRGVRRRSARRPIRSTS